MIFVDGLLLVILLSTFGRDSNIKQLVKRVLIASAMYLFAAFFTIPLVIAVTF